MSEFPSKPCTTFDGSRRIAAGPLAEVAMAVKAAIEAGAAGPVLTFDDATGGVIDLDLRGSEADIVARLVEQGAARRPSPGTAPSPSSGADGSQVPRGRGRPRLGVVAREVTLLPRHWEWLSRQAGGASVTLRRLVDEARRSDGRRDQVRAAREAAYRFMSAMAGDLPGFEEATRALFAGDQERFARHIAGWPADLCAHALKLAAFKSEEKPE